MSWHPDIPEEYRNKIVTGDARELAKRIPDESIDLILCDPPYSLPNNQFRPRARISQKSFGDFSPYQYFFSEITKQAYRILKPQGHFVVFTDEVFYPVIYPALYSNFYATKLIIWNKMRIGMGGIWRRQFELIVDSYKLPQKNKSGDGDIINSPRVKKKIHNSQKPIELLKIFIDKLTDKGDIVCDLFAGSGSTFIATRKSERLAVAFEIDPDTAEKARERVLNTQPPLFVPEPEQLELNRKTFDE